MSRFAVGFIAGCLASLFVGASAVAVWHCFRVTKVHRLEEPLLLAGAADGGSRYALPTGTVLYFDRAYPEGFSQFRVYINVDRMPLRLESLDDATLIDPLDAVAPSQNDIERTQRGCSLDQ